MPGPIVLMALFFNHAIAGCSVPANSPWVPHISLVFREMWDGTNFDHSPLENEAKA